MFSHGRMKNNDAKRRGKTAKGVNLEHESTEPQEEEEEEEEE